MPTHIKGKTLDLVLTNYAPLIDNLSVSGTDSICKSDHFPITFDVKVNVKINKPMKRTVYNFKKASWDALNHDLCHTQWDAMLGTVEPEVAWRRFKSTLFLNVDKYIPKISINCEVQPPWFDSEVHEAYRSKVRAHKQFRTTKSKKDELNTKDVKINDNIDKYNDSIEKINKNETNTEEDMGNDIDNSKNQ